MKKKAKILIVVLSLAIIATFILGWNHTRKTTDDVNCFLDGSYQNFYDGKDAKEFFDEYVDLSEYKDIAFYFSDDGRRIFSLFRAWSVYVVDVYYPREKFEEIVDNFLTEIGEPELGGGFNDFSNYRITKDSSLYKNNSAFICFDTKYHTIRYFFLCNYKVGQDHYVDRYLNFMNWNGGERDWIFDYSDMDGISANDETI